MTSADPAVLGVSRPRPDSRAKVTGATRFAADDAVAGLLYARLVLSPYARARLLGIDREAALAIPGVVAVLVAADLPVVGTLDMRMFEPLARDEITFAGQPVAIVVAETESAAEDGAQAVIVDAEPGFAVTDLEAAMDPASPLARPRTRQAETEQMRSAHAAVGTSGSSVTDDAPMSPNVIGQHHHRRGDVDMALAGSAHLVHRRFQTSWVYQAYLEPHTATARPTPDGGVEVRAATQGTFYTRTQLARIFGLNPARVRVESTPLGGSFGSKILVVEPLAVGAALALSRPVRLSLTRREDMTMTNPAPGTVIEIDAGARSDGELTALRARILFDAGAYSEWTVEALAAIMITGPYRWAALEVDAYGIETNRVGTGSYRAPGGPQSGFAIESVLDELAGRLGVDAAQLRRQNLVEAGDPMADGETWPGIGARECLDRVARHPMWHNREQLPEGEGVGMALGAWPGGREPASALCRLEPDGSLTVITGVVDMSGTDSTLAALAAATFGLAVERVNVVCADTSTAPRSPMTGGSIVTYGAGRAVVAAAAEARERLLSFASERMEIAPTDLEIIDGTVRARGAPERSMTVAELAEALSEFSVTHPPVEGHGPVERPSLAPSSAAHLVHVRVDRETGEVAVLGYVIAQDAGRAINPALVEGQMRGGVAQGLGWALHEELMFDDMGQLLSGTFLDYAIPRATDVPNIETLIVEVPAPDGPYGAKGVGEASVCTGAAAVANAIAAATGRRLDRLPMTAPRVREALLAAADAAV